MNKIARKPDAKPYPDHIPEMDLANKFAVFFFKTKIEKITDPFPDDTVVTQTTDQSKVSGALSTFKEINKEDIIRLVEKCPNKQCTLDPIPTLLLKSAIDVIAPTICLIVNSSLQSGYMLNLHKRAIVTPLIKKANSDNTD